MLKHNKIIALIPARGGSKRLPDKNIRLLQGKPLISYTIKAALQTRLVDRVIVTTDSAKIASVARRHGADIPFIRPKKLASDTAKTIDVLLHAVRYVEKTDQHPDIIVLLQPTSPFTQPKDIEHAIKTLRATKTNSCVSMCSVSEHPEWMFTIHRHHAYPFIKSNNLQKRSQELSKLYTLNGAVYAIRTDFLMQQKKIIDTKSLSSIIMPRERSVDIDTAYDFAIAQTMIKYQSYAS